VLASRAKGGCDFIEMKFLVFSAEPRFWQTGDRGFHRDKVKHFLFFLQNRGFGKQGIGDFIEIKLNISCFTAEPRFWQTGDGGFHRDKVKHFLFFYRTEILANRASTELM